jgi:DNA replication and repair protein RecF
VKIESIAIRRIRNLRDVLIKPPAKFNVFTGDNGQGKTNLLETVYLVSALRSFRASKLSEMTEIGQQTAEVEAIVEVDSLRRHYQVQIEDGRRKATIDGKAVRPVSRYFGDFNVVVFTPDDLYVPRNSPGERRKFLDRAVFNRDASYLATVTDYDKVLRSRNQVLKDLANNGSRFGGAGAMLDVYDDQLVKIGIKIINDRRRYIDELLPIIQSSFESITRNGLHVGCAYQTACTDEATFAALISEQRSKDIARQSTSTGPHRDDLLLTLDGNKAAEYASQGQLRAIVLAWKSAEIALITATRQQTPILLLDDVSSELDALRNSYLFDHLCGTAGQCFITTTDKKHVQIQTDRADFQVLGGTISPA